MKIADCVPGVVVGKLKVIETFMLPGDRNRKVLCKCECGRVCVVQMGDLGGRQVSCGCVRRLGRKAGPNQMLSKTRAYKKAIDAKKRCTCPRYVGWRNYGGRGIEFRFASVSDCAKYLMMLPGYDDLSLTLDRIDTDGHYEPGNLRWTTRSEQVRNRRKYTRRIEEFKEQNELLRKENEYLRSVIARMQS